MRPAGAPSVAAVLVAAVLLTATVAEAGHPWAPAMLTVDPPSARRLAQDGVRLVFVDVRPVAAYRSARLPGARSLPLDELRRRHGEIPKDALVVLYAETAVAEAAPAWRFLASVGLPRVFVLEGGFSAWRDLGYEIER